MFTLPFHETTTKQLVKQIDFLVRYWLTETQILTRYPDCIFIEHVKADDLCVKVLDVLQKNSLVTQFFFNLSMNSPNKKVHCKKKLIRKWSLLASVVCCRW